MPAQRWPLVPRDTGTIISARDVHELAVERPLVAFATASGETKKETRRMRRSENGSTIFSPPRAITDEMLDRKPPKSLRRREVVQETISAPVRRRRHAARAAGLHAFLPRLLFSQKSAITKAIIRHPMKASTGGRWRKFRPIT